MIRALLPRATINPGIIPRNEKMPQASDVSSNNLDSEQSARSSRDALSCALTSDVPATGCCRLVLLASRQMRAASSQQVCHVRAGAGTAPGLARCPLPSLPASRLHTSRHAPTCLPHCQAVEQLSNGSVFRKICNITLKQKCDSEIISSSSWCMMCGGGTAQPATSSDLRAPSTVPFVCPTCFAADIEVCLPLTTCPTR